MASITIAEQEDKLKPYFGAVANMKKVFEDHPDEAQLRELPALLLVPGPATYDRQQRGAQSFRVRRRWNGVFLAANAVKGREFQSESIAKPFLTSIPDHMATYPVITLDDGRSFDLNLHQGTDEGIKVIGYNKQDYLGTVFTFFTVTETYIQPS